MKHRHQSKPRRRPAQVVRQRQVIKAALNQVDTMILESAERKPIAYVFGVGFIY